MFGLFKKKEPTINVINKVWMSENAKWNGCLQLLKVNPNIQFVAWFDETYQKLNAFLEKNHYQHKVIMYRQAISSQSNHYVFAEHYPLYSKEEELYKQLAMRTAIVLSSLDEPLFQQFGSNNIVSLLEKMGINADEVIEHSMISSSIKRAQEKIAAQVLVDNTASNQADWLQRNMK